MTEENKPPYSNTGVLVKPQPVFSFCLDWLRFSVAYDVPQAEILPDWECFRWQGEKGKPYPNYNTCKILNIGRIDWHTEQPEQKQLVTLTGQDLRRIEAAGESIPALLEYIVQHKTIKVSRMDFAMDVRSSGGRPRELHEAMQAGTCQTRAQTSTLWESKKGKEDNGETVYIGSRTSDKFLRVYDKGKEQAMDCDWLRVEIELKNAYARMVARAMGTYGLVEAGKAVIRQYIVTGIDWIDDGLKEGHTGAYLEPVAHDLTDWEGWVINVALPAVLQAIDKDVPTVREEVKKGLKGIYFRKHVLGGKK